MYIAATAVTNSPQISAVTTQLMSEPQCDTPRRLDCGHVGITPDECQRRHCCYSESTIPDVAWCYHGTNMTTQAVDNCSVVEPQSRTDCGHAVIRTEECRERSCCWDQTVRGVPWCFHPAPPPSPSPAAAAAVTTTPAVATFTSSNTSTSTSVACVTRLRKYLYF